MAIPSKYKDLLGYGVAYGDGELRQAIANTEAAVANGEGGGSGGTVDITTLAKEAKQATPEQIKEAIETATNLDQLEPALSQITNFIPLRGTQINGVIMPAGGEGTFGWLSGIWKFVSDIFSNLFGVAAQATDSGNPVKVGGVYRSTPPTLTNGQRGDLLISDRSFLYTDHLDFLSTPNNINTADIASSSVAGNNGQLLITGNPTNNSVASVAGSGNSSFAILITDTWVGTLQFERSLDNGTTWTAIGAFAAGTQFITQTTTLNGAFHGNSSSSTNIRVRATAWTSGVASVRILLGQGTGTITVGNPVRLFDPAQNTYVNIGTAVSANIKSSSGSIFSITCTNLNTSARYLQFFDSTTTPANGATPIRSYPVYAANASGGGYFELGDSILRSTGIAFSSGITFGFSSTPLVYTPGSATDVILVVRFQ